MNTHSYIGRVRRDSNLLRIPEAEEPRHSRNKTKQRTTNYIEKTV